MWRLLIVVGLLAPVLASNILSDNTIQQVNAKQNNWKADRNFLETSTVKNLYSVLPLRKESLPTGGQINVVSLPETFNARWKWRQCPSIGRVKEQGNCASAWAITAAALYADRYCIETRTIINLSVRDILSCCKKCGQGCFGGYVTKAMLYLENHGTRPNACQPFEIPACPRFESLIKCPLAREVTPFCSKYCRRTYKKKPGKGLYFSHPGYSVQNSTRAIMSELYVHGPVLAVIDLYGDLFLYRSGVYSHTVGDFLGHHYVRIVGWGQEDGVPYWLTVNSWGRLWGLQGMLRIHRGSNECNLENGVLAFRPKY